MARPKKNAEGASKTKAPKAIASTQSLGSFVKSICDVMRRHPHCRLAGRRGERR